jgi:hypothetical protein
MAGRASGIAAGVPKRTSSASLVRSMRGTRRVARSKTTRDTGRGKGWNCATRTRWTGPPESGKVLRGLRLITPDRSMTKRFGSSSRKVE